jgi:hypothetical protein
MRAAEALFHSETFSMPSLRNEDQLLGADLIMVLRITYRWLESQNNNSEFIKKEYIS